MDEARLSRCASELYELREFLGAAAEDIRAWHAPGECMGLCLRSANRDTERVLTKYGYKDMDEFEAELTERTCAKFVYEMGFDELTLNP
jgi:hypothetical protein